MIEESFRKKFLWNLGLLCAAQVCVTVYSKAATTTFERRYGLPSTISATISAAYNAASIIGLIITSVFGSKMHRPFWLAIGGLMVSAGAFINTLPQWLSDPYAKEHIFDNITSYDLICGLGPTICDESESSGTESRLFYWILVGEVIMGFGFSGFMTLGMSYLHDISPPEQRAYNQGILLTIFIAGPLVAFGFLLPAVSFQYVDFYRGQDLGGKTTLDYHDPEWVGAWWLGYLISGSVLFIISCFMFHFPRYHSNYKCVKEEPENGRTVPFKQFIRISCDIILPSVSDRGMSRFIPIVLIINHALSSIPISALTTYGGKFLERQYGLSAHSSGAYFGIITVISSMLGTYFGGLYHKNKNLQNSSSARLIAFGTIFATVCVFPSMFIGCYDQKIIGLELNNQTGFLDVVQTECAFDSSNQHCVCKTNQLQIVEGLGELYASPCAAGCSKVSETERSVFEQCACLESSNSTATTKINPCPKSNMWIILATWGLMSFSHGLIGGPYISLLIEKLPKFEGVKVVAFGLMHLLTKIIGYAPGPLIAGHLIDSTCVFWQYSDCDERMSCQLYDPVQYRIYFGLVMFIPGIMATSGFVWVYLRAKTDNENPELSDKGLYSDIPT